MIEMGFRVDLTRAILLLSVMGLALISGCSDDWHWPWQDVKPVHLVLDGTARAGSEPMLLLGDDFEPLADPAFLLIKRDLYDCQGMVAPWFQQVLVAELNYLATKDKLQQITEPVCLLMVDKGAGPKEGRFSVHFYQDAHELKECAINHRCKIARNVSLVLKNELVFRSYFLSDFKREKFFQHCVTPDDMWIPNTTCYEIQ